MTETGYKANPGTNAGPTANMGTRLQALFTDAQSQRIYIELEWLRDQRQYAGVYEQPEVDGFADRQNRVSKTYLRNTMTKVRTMDARIIDLVAGAGRKNWSVRPDDDPDATESMQLEGDLPEDVEEEQKEHTINRLLAARAENMDLEIWGQLQHARYVHLQKRVAHSGHKFGCGIVKGPLATRRQVKRWAPGKEKQAGDAESAGPGSQATSSEADTAWQVQIKNQYAPSWEFVPIWDFYPEMDGWDLNNIAWCFQRHLFHKSDLLELASRGNFFGDEIRRWVQNMPDGDSTPTSWEGELDIIGRYQDSYARARRRKYEVIEYWGPIGVDELKALGKDLPEEIAGQVEGHIWVAKNTGIVIAADINPTAKRERPYSFYVPFNEEGHLFGESVCSIMRDPQRSFNAANRMMEDNGASAVLPQVELDISRMPGAKNVLAMPPGRVWAVEADPYGNNRNALNFTDFPNHAQVYLSMLGFYSKQIDEISGIPAYQQGDNPGSGAGRTASGLSMLMGAAGLLLKNQLYAWDEFQNRVITLAYDWNMQFNPKKDIKGNFKVHVIGSMSLAMREMRAEQIGKVMAMTNNPTDAPMMKRHEELWIYLEENEMDPSRIMKTKQELLSETAQLKKEQADQQAKSQADPIKKAMILLTLKEKMASILLKLAQADQANAKAGDVRADFFQEEMAWVDQQLAEMQQQLAPPPPPSPAGDAGGQATAPAGNGQSPPPAGMSGGRNLPSPPAAPGPSGPQAPAQGAKGGAVKSEMGTYIDSLLEESQTPRRYV
jgi:hypothetical protein